MMVDELRDPNHSSCFDHVIESIIVSRDYPKISKVTTNDIIRYVEKKTGKKLENSGYRKAKVKLADAVTAEILKIKDNNDREVSYQVQRVEEAEPLKRSIILERIDGQEER